MLPSVSLFHLVLNNEAIVSGPNRPKNIPTHRINLHITFKLPVIPNDKPTVAKALKHSKVTSFIPKSLKQRIQKDIKMINDAERATTQKAFSTYLSDIFLLNAIQGFPVAKL